MYVSLPKNYKQSKKIAVFLIFLHVSGQLLPCNGQPDLLSPLRDNSTIFAGLGDNFDTLGMSLELLYTALYDRKMSGN